MSRCFPFPPPGYERKLDDTVFLKKEKRKEKHKKNKIVREKRDGEGKREEKKHKENNDKKDKHKEKKKDKDKRVDQQPESQNEDLLLLNKEHSMQRNSSLGHKKSFLQPQNGEHKELLVRKEEYVQAWGQNEKMLVNRVINKDIDSSKFVQELVRSIREEEKRTGSLHFPVDSRKSNVDRGEIPNMNGQGINNKSTFNRMPMILNTINGKKTLERVNEKNKLTKAEWDINKYMKNGETFGSSNNLSTHNASNVGISHSSSELKKRKDLETNGFSPGCMLTENETRPNKTAHLTSSQPGKSTKIDTKEQKVNGTINSQAMSPVSKKPSNATANQILVKPTSTKSLPVNTGHIPSQPLPVASKPPSSVPNHITDKPFPDSLTQPLLNSKKIESIRPPHPDTKYLKQILAVPELDLWSGLDSQEWLFSGKDYSHFKDKARNIFLQDNKEFEVWSEAKLLESVDVCALPYVIPY